MKSAKNLNNQIKIIIDGSKPIKNNLEIMESLLNKAQSGFNSKPSESSMKYILKISDFIDDVLAQCEQTDDSNEQQIKFYASELVINTIPNGAMKAFDNLKDIQKHVSQLVLSELEIELQRLKEFI